VELPGIVLCAISISLSAMMFWAFTFQVNGFRRPPAGLFLMLVGAADTVVSIVVFRMSRNSEQTHHTFDRQVSNLDRGCRSIHQGFKQLTLRVLSSATAHPPHHEEARARGMSDCRKLSVEARGRASIHGRPPKEPGRSRTCEV
jgi:hypothetical protein